MAKIDLFGETGTTGLKSMMGYVEEAYHADLRWPAVQPLYSRLRRSDPEISIVRQVYTALGRGVRFHWELPDNPSDDDQRAQEFAQSVLEDLDGGIADLAESLVGNVPFFGWGWWEILAGVRDPDWRPPGEDDWRSQYKDGLIGIRRLAWRDSSSFDHWDLDDHTGRLRGMVQSDFPNPAVTIPIERSLHVTFGDPHNPEGLSPLEAVWRLERIKYGLEVIQGIGFEHAAGYLSVQAGDAITSDAEKQIRKAARSIMTAQEGNYAVWPKNFVGELVDVPFQAAAAVLDAIRYFSILKLMVYNMQWMALSATTGSGSYSAMADSSSMFIITYNAMLSGFANQIDRSLGRLLFKINAGAFPGMTRRPRLTVDPVQKVISLTELAQILGPIKNTLPLGEEDLKAIRARTGFLPETLPETETETPEETKQDAGDEEAEGVSTETPETVENRAQRSYQALSAWRSWTRDHEPETYRLLNERLK